MRRLALAVVVSFLVAPAVARANDFVTSDDKTMDAMATDAVKDLATDGPIGAKDEEAAPPLKLQPKSGSLAGVSMLRSMYASLGMLQAYDVYSTQKALRNGAVERNPFMQGAVGNQALFIGLKVAMTAGPVYQAEKLWRNHRRVSAIALMATSNGIMMAVAAHNTATIRKVQASRSAVR